MKASLKAMAHCVSSFLFVAEWSWQQAWLAAACNTLPVKAHTVSTAGIYSLYIPIITVLLSLVTVTHFITLGDRAEQVCHGMGALLSLYPSYSSLLRNVVGLTWHCWLGMLGAQNRSEIRYKLQAVELACCKTLITEVVLF